MTNFFMVNTMVFTVEEDQNGVKWLLCNCGTRLRHEIFVNYDDNAKRLLDIHIQEKHPDKLTYNTNEDQHNFSGEST